MEISFTPGFIKKYDSLEKPLKEEVVQKIELLKKKDNHEFLKVHKLKGRLRGRYSFSVNYKIRIVFSYTSKKEVLLHAIGDHDIYN